LKADTQDAVTLKVRSGEAVPCWSQSMKLT